MQLKFGDSYIHINISEPEQSDTIFKLASKLNLPSTAITTLFKEALVTHNTDKIWEYILSYIGSCQTFKYDIVTFFLEYKDFLAEYTSKFGLIRDYELFEVTLVLFLRTTYDKEAPIDLICRHIYHKILKVLDYFDLNAVISESFFIDYIDVMVILWRFLEKQNLQLLDKPEIQLILQSNRDYQKVADIVFQLTSLYTDVYTEKQLNKTNYEDYIPELLAAKISFNGVPRTAFYVFFDVEKICYESIAKQKRLPSYIEDILHTESYQVIDSSKKLINVADVYFKEFLNM